MADWDMRVAELRMKHGYEDTEEFLKALGITQEVWDAPLTGDAWINTDIHDKLVALFDLDEEEATELRVLYWWRSPDNPKPLEDNVVTGEGKPVRVFSYAAAALACFVLLDAADGVIDGQISILFHGLI